jgi:hypothetical protein
MTAVLDHLFVLATPGAPLASRLVDAGFVEGAGRRHPGQGTANRRFFFQNAMLEFLFVVSEDELRSAAVARTRLLERSRFRENSACPIGLGFRLDAASGQRAPWPSWEYTPPYLLAGDSLRIAVDSDDERLPLVFFLPPSERPTPGPHDPRRISRIELALPEGVATSDQHRDLVGLGLNVVSTAMAPFLTLELDDGRSRALLDLRPDASLILRW